MVFAILHILTNLRFVPSVHQGKIHIVLSVFYAGDGGDGGDVGDGGERGRSGGGRGPFSSSRSRHCKI